MYSIAAQGDTGLRRQIATSWLPLVVKEILLLHLAAIGGEVQAILFAVAVLGGWLSIYLTIVLIVRGESLVAVGTGAAEHPSACRC